MDSDALWSVSFIWLFGFSGSSNQTNQIDKKLTGVVANLALRSRKGETAGWRVIAQSATARLLLWLEFGKPSDSEAAGEGGYAGIIGEELITARELCGGDMNGVRQLESCLSAKASGRNQDLAADRRHVQGCGGLQNLQIGSLPLGMMVEQRFDQRFRQRQFTGDGHKITPIQGGEECGEHGAEGRIPFEGIDEDIGIEIDTPRQG